MLSVAQFPMVTISAEQTEHILGEDLQTASVLNRLENGKILQTLLPA